MTQPEHETKLVTSGVIWWNKVKPLVPAMALITLGVVWLELVDLRDGRVHVALYVIPVCSYLAGFAWFAHAFRARGDWLAMLLTVIASPWIVFGWYWVALAWVGGWPFIAMFQSRREVEANKPS
jgi:hypothetical protein